METFIQQILNGLVLGSMYSLIALGYTMVYGILNLINFAHGDVPDSRCTHRPVDDPAAAGACSPACRAGC